MNATVEAATPTRPLAGKSIAELSIMQDDIALDDAHLKQRKIALAEELTARFGGLLLPAFAGKGVAHGTTTLSVTLSNSIRVKGAIDKKVEWDTARLEAVMPVCLRPVAEGGLGWDWTRLRSLFDVKMSIKERDYTAAEKLLPAAVFAAIQEARTVKYGALKVELVSGA